MSALNKWATVTFLPFHTDDDMALCLVALVILALSRTMA